MLITYHIDNRGKNTLTIGTFLCAILIIVSTNGYGQTDTSGVNWWYPSAYVPPKKYWIEDSSGIVCVQYDSAKNEFRYGQHATHVRRRTWKVSLGACDTTSYYDERYCNGYWLGRFKKTEASQYVKENFQCDFEYIDITRKGLIWALKTYSQSGELLEVDRRVLIGYYHNKF